mgnify:FL=1
MFGYVIVNKGEMKFKEFDIYHAYYCGLCRLLKEKYGLTGQLSLSYDMTFVILLLSGLYEPDTVTESCKCIAHPLEKHMVKKNECTEYAADMNILLTYYKCLDDWQDDRKCGKRIYAGLLEKGYRAVGRRHGGKVRAIEAAMRQLTRKEKEGCTDIDEMSRLFGEVMAQIMVYRNDEWKDCLYRIGMYLGKFIYLCDAYEDVEKDMKTGSYNPLRNWYGNPDFEERCRGILVLMMSECSREFEKLPILEHAGILRNILYSGVWYRFEKVRGEREAAEKAGKRQ